MLLRKEIQLLVRVWVHRLGLHVENDGAGHLRLRSISRRFHRNFDVFSRGEQVVLTILHRGGSLQVVALRKEV